MQTDLREKLRAALHQPTREGGTVARAESVTELDDLSALGGHWFQSPFGPGYVIESVYEGAHSHGNIPLYRALGADAAKLAGQVRDQRLAEVAPRDFLFIDTETTGLGGAGSMVFLAGVAKFDGSLLRLRQYLLPSPQYEGGLLGGLAEDIAAAGALVSYNGKSFDLPMLETRYILSRQDPVLRTLPHLDLLHPNRRLFRGAFDSHRLVRMEVELLGFEREDDCPSAEVPQRYFRFQHSGDPTPILPVLRHNAWDVLSLVALSAHLAGVCEGDALPLQAGRAAEYAGDVAHARVYYAEALDGSLNRGTRIEVLERLARCAAKEGDWAGAATWWRALINEPRSRRLTPYVELAKILEHRERDIPAALTLMETAHDMLDHGLLRPGAASSEVGRAAVARRTARLRARADC